MIGWGQIGYGAALSGLLAAVVLALAARPHRLLAALGGGIATVAGAVSWNAILRAAHGNQFFTDAPVAVLPASWQDTGKRGPVADLNPTEHGRSSRRSIRRTSVTPVTSDMVCR